MYNKLKMPEKNLIQQLTEKLIEDLYSKIDSIDDASETEDVRKINMLSLNEVSKVFDVSSVIIEKWAEEHNLFSYELDGEIVFKYYDIVGHVIDVEREFNFYFDSKLEYTFDGSCEPEYQKFDPIEESPQKPIESTIPSSKRAQVEYINNKAFSKKMGISERTSQTWRSKGLIPFSKFRGRVYYRVIDINNMLDAYSNRPVMDLIKLS